MIKKLANLLFLIVLGSVKGFCMEQPITLEHLLNNGLRIVVREDHRAPVVVAQIWYKVGSGKEPMGITGISHALEHMMFQGTPKLPGDGFAMLISEYGGNNNAFTSDDFTAYYEELDATNLPISFELEADRMQNLTLSKEAFDKEIQVVIEERRLRTDDNPQSLTWERFMAVAHDTGPYHHPVIGWQNDLDHMTVDDLRKWYQSWYVPNNATIIVVGDVKASAVFELVEKYFGAIASRATPEVKPFVPLKPLGEKRITVNLPAKLPYAIWGFDVPSLKTAENEKEAYALVVIDALLTGGESARMNRDLVRGAQIAAKVNTNYDLFKAFPTQFILTGIPAQKHTIKELEEKLMAQITRLKEESVAEEELQKTKNQLLAQEVFEKDSMSSQAILLGILETVGLSWKVADTFREKIQAVTAADIQQVAQKYFLPTQMTVAELVPHEA